MIIANGIFLLLLAGYFLFSRTISKEWMKEVDKKEHKLSVLYPMAKDILIRTGLYRILQKKRDVSTVMRALYVTNKPETAQLLYWCRKVSLTILLFAVFSLLSLVWQLEVLANPLLREGRYLVRPEQGEGSYEAELSVKLKEQGKKGTKLSEELDITVEERRYTGEEVYRILEDSIGYVKKAVLGNNQSPYNLHEPLNFFPVIPGTAVTIEWKPEDYRLIHSDGTLGNEELEKATAASVIATLSCQEQKKDVRLDFIIMPVDQSEPMDDLSVLLENEVQKASEVTADQKHLVLPREWGKFLIYWEEKKKGTELLLWLFGITASLLVWRAMDHELESKMRLRKEQLLSDYPEIINKFTLLVNAGMTIRQAWFRISEDYSEMKADGAFDQNRKERYAYEEMLATASELRLGVSETIAYEQYGRRIGLIPYIKFGTLITQNLKKGNRGFTELLKYEAAEAFEERKETAKRLGEEAGTKLLMPMLLMLVLVFMIILIPAFISFQM
jgi:hypothetical protein